MHDIAYHYPNAANNRLGNVTATIPDRKRLVLNAYGNMVYIPLPVSYTDYYPFGYSISDRNYYSGGGTGMWRCGSWREDKGKIKI
jgi:hypothetical protein